MSASELAPLLSALRFASLKHSAQRRKDSDKTPYVNHPIAVAELLARVGGERDPEVLMAALLHDTVEDTDTTPAELESHFGKRVRKIVEELTDDKSLPKDERKRLQVVNAPHKSPEAKRIKFCDKICNVSDLTPTEPAHWTLVRKREYLDWAEKVLAGCRGAGGALEAHFDEVLARKRKELGEGT